jgi:hypothetical protein
MNHYYIKTELKTIDYEQWERKNDEQVFSNNV